MHPEIYLISTKLSRVLVNTFLAGHLRGTIMGFAINLETERGEPIKSIEDPGNILHRLLERSVADEPHLAEIDWFGDTTFNRLQMPRFLVEWGTLARHSHASEEVKLIADIRQLAERCASGVHLYLKFVGD